MIRTRMNDRHWNNTGLPRAPTSPTMSPMNHHAQAGSAALFNMRRGRAEQCGQSRRSEARIAISRVLYETLLNNTNLGSLRVEFPKVQPQFKAPFLGFTKTAEIWNSSACMIRIIGVFTVELDLVYGNDTRLRIFSGTANPTLAQMSQLCRFESIAAKLVANLITEAGANRVLACDLHSGQSMDYFDIPVDHVYG
ncbi:hypothetical protein K1719_035318 [Acacia pycnantha]|nr:hypothetical protein K1719_035318 [Acacia pycnantha]